MAVKKKKKSRGETLYDLFLSLFSNDHLLEKCFKCFGWGKKNPVKPRATLCNAGMLGVNLCDLVVIKCSRL